MRGMSTRSVCKSENTALVSENRSTDENWGFAQQTHAPGVPPATRAYVSNIKGKTAPGENSIR